MPFSEGRKKPNPVEHKGLGLKITSIRFCILEKRPKKTSNQCETKTDNRRKTKANNQCKIKKINSFIRSQVDVFWLSSPLLFASISLSLDRIKRVFIAV